MRAVSLLSGLGLLARLTLASPLIDENLQSGVFKREELEHFKRQEEELAAEVSKVTPPSCHTPNNRACWSPGFDINTNWYEKTPNTGVTRKYYLELTEHDNWIAGDGHKKEKAMLINGKFPGPTLVANWGDWMEVRVTNKMRTNGTSIHWHGIRFLRNSVNDGANGVTECPLPPGASKTYRFRVEQYGTGWFHSHFSSQYSNGVVGTLIFHGPAALPYEEDLGVFDISDWYWKSADKIFYEMIDPNQEFPGDNPDSNNVLFNGKHTNVEDGKGSYYRTQLKKGKKHRLRIINTSVDNSFTVSLVNHKMTIIQTDYVPIRPRTTDSIFVSMGQRYDVIIDANQPVGNYWFNVTYSKNFNCGETKAGKPAAIFDYEGADCRKLPTIQGGPVEEHLCQDKIDYEPIVPIDVPKPAFQASENNTLAVNFTFMPWQGGSRIYWTINKQDLNVSWEQPTLKYLAEGKTEFPQRYNTILEPEADVWSFWVLENLTPISHPMHLHGHDLFVLGHSDPPEKPLEVGMTHFDPVADLPKLRFKNPARRDVIHLPSMGWFVVAFKTDNPGVWLFHCHIAWHAGQGLSLQVVERASEIPKSTNLAELEPTCSQWKKWYATSPTKQFDSGV